MKNMNLFLIASIAIVLFFLIFFIHRQSEKAGFYRVAKQISENSTNTDAVNKLKGMNFFVEPFLVKNNMAPVGNNIVISGNPIFNEFSILGKKSISEIKSIDVYLVSEQGDISKIWSIKKNSSVILFTDDYVYCAIRDNESTDYYKLKRK